MTDCPFDRIGVGQEDHVPVFDRAVEPVEERADIAAKLADDHPALVVGNQREGIALLADTGRHGSADQRGIHLNARIPQRILDDVERNRINRPPLERGLVGLDDGGAHGVCVPQAGVIMMLPNPSTVPMWRVSMSVVESISVTMAGPLMMSPARSFARS